MSEQGWARKKIGQLLVRHFAGAWGEDPGYVGAANVVVLRSTNLDDSGGLTLSTGAPRRFTPKELTSKRLVDSDILLEASGGGPGKPVGRVALFQGDGSSEYACSNFFRALRVDGSLVNPKFLATKLQWLYRQSSIWRYQQQTTGIINLRFGDYLDQEIELPPLDQQRRIAEILDVADEQIQSIDHLVSKLRLICIGIVSDALNEIEQTAESTALLSEVADISSGVTLGSEPAGDGSIEVPYLRVANVQDGYIDTSEVKAIRIFRSQMERFRLEAGDVLLTEGGDFDKLGRGAVWDARIPECICQNHIFRVRCDRQVLLPEYLAAYASSPRGRAYFLSIAKQTTNLATINSTQLKSMPLPLPSLERQQKLIDAVEACSGRIQAELKVADRLRLLKQGLIDDLLTGRVRVPL
ncbi:restriction endonuclease subunit S [Actinomadura fulvescens]|uniref:Type I restriction modification DNA specificity domain-containing protein n=1 Tax=Actinomadura fulvescens TaxID=46160 RepID=A0ABN3Q121_9ACTN